MNEDIQTQIDDLKDTVDNMSLKRIGQEMIIPSSIKKRAIGEGVPYVDAGLEAKRPSLKSPAQGQQIWFSTDTKKLWISDGSTWRYVQFT